MTAGEKPPINLGQFSEIKSVHKSSITHDCYGSLPMSAGLDTVLDFFSDLYLRCIFKNSQYLTNGSDVKASH